MDFHQLLFREAFPNRKGGDQQDEIAKLQARYGRVHHIRVSDGAHFGAGGWPSVFANHVGNGF